MHNHNMHQEIIDVRECSYMIDHQYKSKQDAIEDNYVLFVQIMD
jgi:hypothetical protein